MLLTIALVGCSDEPAPSSENKTLPSPTSMSTLTPTLTPTPKPTSTPALRYMGNELTLLVVSVEHAIPEYSRKEWRNWIDEDGDCQNTRQEVLIRQSTSPVTYVDEEQCRVASGTWVGPFSRGEFMDPIYLHIDHMVPFANAHKSGGSIWSEEKKRQYTNDLSYDGHLIAVRTTVNSSKGDNGPEQWKPPVEGYWCQYAIDWITVKDRWELFASEAEAAALAEMLETCTPALTLTVIPHDIPQPEATPSPTATVEPTPSPSPTIAENYESCEAAEEAGEPRILGSSGLGRGFPMEKVPGARDGDGDGVVCESTSSPTPTVEATPSPTPTIEPTPSPSPTISESYESCAAAEEAGEPRIQGSSGSGRGFPIEKVPGARDGDGDGVVCESTSSPTPTVEATPSPTPTIEPTPSPSPTISESYESCAAAEEAGEPRIQGSSGSGRGFPIEKVPGARDGDGDGVVCEN